MYAQTYIYIYIYISSLWWDIYFLAAKVLFFYVFVLCVFMYSGVRFLCCKGRIMYVRVSLYYSGCVGKLYLIGCISVDCI
jgi:hypothetical protein